MVENQGFKYAFGWNVYYQKLLGMPTLTGTEQRLWFWMAIMIFTTAIPQTASLPFLWGDLNSIIECLSTNLAIIIAVTKIATLQCKRKVIASILSRIFKDWLSVKSQTDRAIMLETAELSRLISIVSVSLSNILVIGYTIFRVSNDLQNGKDPDRDPRLAFGFVYDSYFPFDTTNKFVFVPLWIGQFFGMLLSSVAYSGADCFVSMAVLHTCGQLATIRYSLKRLVNDDTRQDPKKYWKTLAEIVRKHETINELALVIGETFSTILLVQIIACSVIFCFQGYAMFTTFLNRKDASIAIFDLYTRVVYATFSVTHLFIYCYVGERLLHESTEIGNDFYNTEWYSVAPEEARAFIFVSHRSRIPLELSAGKFCTFNLELFNNIMKTSMGYLSMLMAMKERLVD